MLEQNWNRNLARYNDKAFPLYAFVCDQVDDPKPNVIEI